ncbi:hypothetical protein HK405_013318, partial [Cladochytrium tenue]
LRSLVHTEAAANTEATNTEAANTEANTEEVELQDIRVHSPAGSSTSPQTGSNTVLGQDNGVGTAAPDTTAATEGNSSNDHQNPERGNSSRKMPVEVRIDGGYWKNCLHGLAHYATSKLRRADWLRNKDKNDMN